MYFRKLALACSCVWLFIASVVYGAEQKKIVADFEDFGTWRLREWSGMLPGAWWAGITVLGGTDTNPHHGSYSGELNFRFDPNSDGPFRLGFERQKMAQVSGFLTAIEFYANGNALPVSVRFELVDSAHQTFLTHPVAITGEGWQLYRIDLNGETVPGIERCRFPARLKRITLEASRACEGEVFLDDITLVGRFTKKDQLAVVPVYEGIYYEPQKPVTLRYRAYNAQPQEQSGGVGIEIFDFSGKSLMSHRQSITLPAHGNTEFSFDLGVLPIGAYEVVLNLEAGNFTTTVDDVFGVFVANNGRINRHPMWFGVQDQATWQSPFETARHMEWMKVIGIDIDRVVFSSYRVEREPGIAEEGWRRLFNAYQEQGLDVLMLYGENVPPWTQTTQLWRGGADKLDLFEEFAERFGVLTAEFPNIKYVEFWNEPDLEFYIGDLQSFTAMLERFYKGVRRTNPDLRVTSGGVTIKHPREKPGFSKGMYQQAADFYDVAAYHAHGPIGNNVERQETLEKWLAEAGLEKPFINTETGDRSLYDAQGRRRQAIGLVKKIVYSKSIPNFEAYFWFTLQDFWDMDPEADDSFGLVTSDNRAKPSFVAYNALIAELANTTPQPEKNINSDGLVFYAFLREDGRYVYAGWPSSSRSNGILWLKSDQAVEVRDIFGVLRRYEPLGEVLPIAVGEEPIYIRGAQVGKTVELCSPEEAFLSMSTEVVVPDGKSVVVPVFVRNPMDKQLEGQLVLRSAQGQVLDRTELRLPAAGSEVWKALIPAGVVSGYDLVTCELELSLTNSVHLPYRFPMQLIGTYSVAKVEPLGSDPALWPLVGDSVATVIIDRPEDVVELTYDPAIRAWQGPQDLSARAQLVHDGAGIRVRIVVTDDVQGPLQSRNSLWMGDDVQIALGASDNEQFAIIDLGLSTDGPAAWCSRHIDPARTGVWDIPLSVIREGDRTVYDAYFPFAMLGLPEDSAGTPIRWTFLVNENDGQGRVRWIQWKDGIGKNRSLEFLGYGELE